eukprot:CAMPEP_0206021368 /NCGR_PEP_ID=MMETSP1464-20131121/32743_1 /ASSEMBLY_ACC=CAM_ASM_001124 /TAXON_ID=119497 /ORGANISM="Exanthemachrysis gayraliae, Strain RCC1523" /LENGTH=69 /DNA_ID=CAMNT_0053395311 /DNA_START=31 /DNA_END=237 /DNA_ORIENTATION=-
MTSAGASSAAYMVGGHAAGSDSWRSATATSASRRLRHSCTRESSQAPSTGARSHVVMPAHRAAAPARPA